MDVKTVGVVGAGLMGSGIIEAVARGGYDVVAREIDESAVAGGKKRIERSHARALERGKITEEQRNVENARITWTTDLNDLKDCDLVIEAIVENLDMKKDIFSELSRITRPEVILASNTSSVSITALAAATNRPDRVAGMHFFNPVPVMKLVELVQGLQTSQQTLDDLRAFAGTLDKTVVTAKDTPGFIVNYLLVPYLLEAVKMVEDNVATKEDIDTAIQLGLSHPMGPLTLLDFVGLDTTLFIADVMFEEFRQPKYAAPPLLRKMVTAGYLGRKSGRGFYEYNT
jgi:3-hydroxybutyryl-CoA dehydrogenase